MTIKKYVALPTLERFHNDRKSTLKYVEGPFGSGKTTGCIMELLMRSFRQQPDENNARRTRWVIIRNTYPELKTTTIKSYERWVPNEIAPVVYTTPINSKFRQRSPDGSLIDAEFIFMALDTPEDVAKLLSLEITGAYINEGREVPVEIRDGLLGRIGRYPETIKDENGRTIFGPTEPGIIVDSNPPNNKHWLFTTFESTECPEDFSRFIQPPAVFKDPETGKYVPNPDAENLMNLPDGYYVKQLSGTEDHIRINLAGEYGMTRAGKPVFAKFSASKHVAKEIIRPARGLSLIIGLDFGLTPAAVIGQLHNQGVRIYEEIPAADESLEDFLDDYILPLLRGKYQGYNVVVCGDPAGSGRSRLDKRNDFQVLQSRNLTAYPAITNSIVKRKETVDYFLGRDGGFLMSMDLHFLRETLEAGYVFKELKNKSGAVTETPDKNEYSHIADALQYLCLYARYGAAKTVKRGETNKPKKRVLWA